MKKLFTTALGLAATLAALAIPAKPGLRTITQPDGTTVTVRLMGDERFHTLVTTDGLAVGRDALTGQLCYRTASGALSTVAAHNPGTRSAAEADFLAANASQLTATSLASKALKSRAAKAPAKALSQVPHNGTARVPVILVGYSDYNFRDGDKAATTFENFFNGPKVSARQYYVDQSNGKYTPQFDIYGPVILPNKRAYYGGNKTSGGDLRPGAMVAAACQKLDSEIDFSQYDNDGDGECDVVIILYAGDGEASSYDSDCENSIWPHQWELSASDYRKSLTLDGTRVDKYACFNELYGGDLTQIDGIGIVCHEFGHCLGLPDFYDVNYGNNFGMSVWSVMDTGSYNDDGYTPLGFSAYEKEYMDWVTLAIPEPNTTYTLPVWNSKKAENDVAYKLVSDKNPNEFFVLENRQKQGWDKYMPTSGMLITHVSFIDARWTNNTVNTSSPNLCTPVPADNSLKMTYDALHDAYYPDEASYLGDLWPYNNKKDFTDTTAPAAKLNLTSGLLGKPVTDITRNADGTISFTFMKGVVPALPAPTLLEPTNVTSYGFDIAWTSPEAAEGTSYTLEVAPYTPASFDLLLKATFPDATKSKTWTTSGYTISDTAGGTECLRLGSAKNTGGVKSPAVTPTQSVVTVSFSAMSYGSDNTTVTVSLYKKGGSTAAAKINQKLTDNFATYSVTLPAEAGTDYNVEIATSNIKSRFYLAEASIYSGDATEAAVAAARAKAETIDEANAPTPETVTIGGLTDTFCTVTGLVANTTYAMRVKATPADLETLAESPWSNRQVVTLSENGSTALGLTPADTATSAPEYFTLQGVKVAPASLTPGIYLLRQGTHTQKIVVR